MKMRIIKRWECENVGKGIPAEKGRSKSIEGGVVIAATVRSWIEELRQKRNDDRRSIQQLFKV